ncbi:MAG: tetratricopeptide repeat protein [bacterium]|nr:tetratricopeptide repeat protein [bacterium]
MRFLLCILLVGVLAQACVTKNLEREPLERRAEVATFQEDWRKAADLWYRVYQIDGGKEPRPAFETARALLEGGDPAGALALVTASLERHAGDATLLEISGRASVALGSHGDAAGAFERAVASDASCLACWRGLAQARLALGEHGAAAEALEAARELDPEDAQIALELARLLASEGHSVLALEAYRAAFARIEGHPSELLEAALLACGDPESPAPPAAFRADVIAWLRRACDLDPQLVPAHLARGRLLESDADLRGAVAHYERVVEIEPNHAPALEWLAIALAADGQSARARTIIEHALGVVEAEERGVFEELGRALDE